MSAPIYYFKAEGNAQPAPEPTNYPDNFTATVNGLSITLTWNDATGGQLPNKYLVIGSVGSISVPIDGIPIPDGALAKNVNYGVQTVTFSGLNSNTTYHFAIFPYTNSGADINYKNGGNFPTANATTENITVLLSEEFNDNLGVFTTYDVLGNQSWHQGSYQGITYANMNGYANQTYNPNEDWLISPAINKTGFSDVFVEFRTAKKFEGPDLQVLVSTNYNGVGTPNNYSWVDITNAFSFSTGNYEWVESGRANIEITSNTFYLAFVYTSNAIEAPSWEIDYVNIEASDNGTSDYTITAIAEPSNGGTISGAGTYTQGSTCILSAMPSSGFVFEHWTRNGLVVSTEPSYSFIVIQSNTYVAHFTQNANQATITATAEPIEGGSVSGGGTYELGDDCTLNAIAAVGYEFIEWTRDGSTVSTEAIFSFSVTGNAVYVAHFAKIVNNYAVTVSLDPSSAGAVIGAGTHEEGTSCTLIAIANPTYTFVSWTENGAVVSSDNHYTFTVERNRTLVAVFSQGLFYTITASASANGTISPEGEIIVEPGEDKTFAIIPDNGCVVSKVIVDGVDEGPLESRTFRNVNGNHSIHVEFSGWDVEDWNEPQVKIYPNPANAYITIEAPMMKAVTLFDLLGTQRGCQEVHNDTMTWHLDGLSQGTYLLKVEFEDGRVGYTRFMVVR